MDGTAKTATADENGDYSLTVLYGWSGTVTPSLDGYTFNPPSWTYTDVMADRSAQDYSALSPYTISGNAGVAGATLSYMDGTAKTTTADENGDYRFIVSFDWSGTVTPSLDGYTFTPASKTYTGILADQTAQDYSAHGFKLRYQGHFTSQGWRDWVYDGDPAGTPGSTTLEAIDVETGPDSGFSIQYMAHVQEEGWQDWRPGGTVAGTTGHGHCMEAFKVQLVDGLPGYSVKYRANVYGYGWLDWEYDGTQAGTTGLGWCISAIEIMIAPTPDSPVIQYQTHEAKFGWLGWVNDGMIAGTVGDNEQVEAMQIQLAGPLADYQVSYRSYVEVYGWLPWVSDGATSGTTGESKRVEAIEIQLVDAPPNYHIAYQVHTLSGWQPWKYDGEQAGQAGLSQEIYALRIAIVSDGPVLDFIGAKTVSAGKTLAFQVASNALCFDTPDALLDHCNTLPIYSADNLPHGSSFDPAMQTFNWTPTPDQEGTFTVSFSVTMDLDGQRSNSESVVITVREPPTIAFTYVPPYASFDNLQGTVETSYPADYKVVVYIYVSGWWIKPYFAAPLTTIQSNGYWSTDITTGGTDQLATKIAAFVVPNGYNPPLATGYGGLPQELYNVAEAYTQVERQAYYRTIEFSGYTWKIKASETPANPGPNYYSDNENDVWVDGNGHLHMKISYRNGKWYSSEVFTEKQFGYGTYAFTLANPIDQLDKNAVLGLFTWDDTAPGASYRENDIQFSRWGLTSGTNSEYVVQPWDQSGNLHTFNTTLVGTFSTHGFTWLSDQVQFSSHQGHAPILGDPIESWTYTGGSVHPEGKANARVNLWLFNAVPPSDGQGIDVEIESFEFAASAPSAQAILSAPVSTIDTNQPHFSWNFDTTASWYYLEVSSSNGDPVVAQWYRAADICNRQTCSAPIEVVLPKDTLTWRVQPMNAAGRGSWSDTATFTVTNGAPIVDAGQDTVIYGSSTFSGSGSFTDNGIDTWTATVDYGEGAGLQPLALTGKTFTLSHTYATTDYDVYTVKVCVSDDSGGTGCDSFTVTIDPQSPTLTPTPTPTDTPTPTFTPTSLPTSGTISGTVFEADGTTPIANMAISLTTLTNEEAGRACSAANGHFVLDSVPFEVGWQVSAVPSWRCDQEPEGYVREYWQNTRSRDGATVITLDANSPNYSSISFSLDQGETASGVVGPSGGQVSSPDNDVMINIPPAAISTDIAFTITAGGSDYHVESDAGGLNVVSSSTIGPEGTTFAVPVSLTFTWADMDNDGIVDGTTFHEDDLYLSKNGVVIAGPCHADSNHCDKAENEFSVQVSSLSEFVIGVPAGDLMWRRVWGDEFNGSSGLDPSNWICDTGTSYPGGPSNWGTGEVQSYTCAEVNVFQSGGSLSIRSLHTGTNPASNWISGRIETARADFQAPSDGAMAVEARIKLPEVTPANGLGYWPAFWMLGSPYRGNYWNWPGVGEIDIMENANGLNQWWGTLHCGTNPGGPCNETNGLGGSVSNFDPSLQTAFHTYRVELDKRSTPQQIRWYVDGIERHMVSSDQMDANTWEGATNHGFFIILNLAMGGWPSNPSGATISGGTMLVDYVRVYSLDMPTVNSISLASPNPTTAANVDFTVTFSEQVTGVDISDFTLHTSGLKGAYVSSVSGSGATYTVTVHTGTGHGTLALTLLDDDSIQDLAGNPLGGTGTGNGNFTGETYTTERNHAPEIMSNGGGNAASLYIAENTTAITTVIATDEDDEDTLTFSISGGADKDTFSIDPASGVLAFTSAPNFEAPIDADADNIYEVTVQVSDGELTDSQAISVEVTDANEAPVIQEGSTISPSFMLRLSLTLHAVDPEGDTLTWEILTPPEHGTAMGSGTGTSQWITYMPTTTYHGQDSFVVRVSDEQGNEDTITIMLDVNSYHFFLPFLTR